ncbi:hypothetical protein [Plantactinospora sp. CA-290183]|uniref:hypothetical protein n=1 Tax=Plantactinospora sp. CA-290183 TaxID=3240006 RepID=UPI003D8DAA29
MRGWFPLAVGLLGVVVGALWTVQGLGYLDGSAMSGERLWVVVGPVVGVAGLVMLVVGLRLRRRADPGPGPRHVTEDEPPG